MAAASSSSEKPKYKPRKHEREIKLSVVGAHFSGKTAYLIRYLTKRFIDKSQCEGGSNYRTELNVDGDFIIVQITDTYYQEPFALPSAERIAGSDGMLLVYSVTERASFDHVRHIKAALPQDMPIVLVGTKRDAEQFREVSTEEGENLARELDCPFYEVSAVEPAAPRGDDPFTQLCREVVAYRNRPKQTTSLLTRVLKGFRRGKGDSALPPKQ